MKPVDRKTMAVAGALCSVGIALGWTLSQPAVVAPGIAATPSQPVTLESYGKLPLFFEENRGQTDEAVKFLSRGPGYILFLTPSEQVMRLHSGDKSDTLTMALKGANPQPRLVGEDLRQGKSNYLGGGRNITGVPHHGKVRYAEVYPGIDLVFYGNPQQLEYDFVVAPGADPQQILLSYRGANTARINERGDLELALSGGTVVQKKPVVYQEINGQRVDVAARYEMSGAYQVAFALDGYDASQPLVIDPVLIYSTYLGGNAADFGDGIAVDANGFAYIAGSTISTEFNTVGAIEGDAAPAGDANMVVSKLNATGSALIYSTYITGAGGDSAFDIAVDAQGNAIVAGSSSSADFDAPGATCADNNVNATILKLNANGSGLVYIRCFGGASSDFAVAVATDGQGRAYVGGRTDSINFPVTAGVIQPARAEGNDTDGFVARFSSAGVLEYSTYIGGNGFDIVKGIDSDAAGNAYVTGETGSANFQTTAGVIAPLPAAGANAFVVKLNDGATSRLYSTFLGGAGSDVGNAIAVNANGEAYIAGFTSSADFPRVPATNPAIAADADAFVTKLNNAATAVVYSRYLGGNGSDEATAIALDSAGLAYVGGFTASTNFPATDSLAGETDEAGLDGFVTKLNAAGTSAVYSTYLGGNAEDRIEGIDVDAFGNAYVTGFTLSTNFNRVAPFIDDDEAVEDAFVAKIGEPGTLQFLAGGFSTPEAVGISQAVLISRTGGSSTAVSVNCATAAGGTAGNTDFAPRNGVITWNVGEAGNKPCPVGITQDQEQEQTETVNLVLSAPTGGATLGPQQTTALSILDDDTPPSVLEFVNTTMTVRETVSTNPLTQVLNIPVRRSGSSAGAVAVQCSTSNGTAAAPLDFTAVANQTLNWANGDNADKNCQVTIVNDTTMETPPTETFTVTLANPSGATTTANLGTATTSTITIQDDDQRGKLRFSAASYTVGEGDNASANFVTMIVKVQRVEGSDGAVSALCVADANTDTNRAGAGDFTISAARLTWGDKDAGEKSCSITIVDDTIFERTETLRLKIDDIMGGATAGTPDKTILNINDNDGQSRIRLTADRYEQDEGREVTITLKREVVADSPPQNAVSVCLETQQNTPFGTGSATAGTGTGTAPGDFIRRIRNQDFPETCSDSDGVRVPWGAGDIADKTIKIALLDDELVEGAETFSVFLSEPLGNASLGTPNSATVTIRDLDRVQTGSQSGSAGLITVSIPSGQGSLGGIGPVNQKPLTFDAVVNDPNRVFLQGVDLSILNVAPGGTVQVTVVPPAGTDTGFVLACTQQGCVRVPVSRLSATSNGVIVSLTDGLAGFDGDGEQNGRIAAQLVFLRNLLVDGEPIDIDDGGGSLGSALLLVLGFAAVANTRRRRWR